VKNELENEKQKFRLEIGSFFDAHNDKEDRFTSLLSAVEILIKEGLLDKTKITSQIKECSEVENRNEFIDKTLIVFGPILEIKKSNPRILEKQKAEIFVKEGKYIKINDILSYGAEENSVHLHLAPSKELLREIGKEEYQNLILDGFRKLALIIKENEDIKEVTATSPVVTNNPKGMEKFGFIVVGPMSEEDRIKHWKGGEKNVSQAYIPREIFLEKYL